MSGPEPNRLRAAITFPLLPTVRDLFERRFDVRFATDDALPGTDELLAMADGCDCLFVSSTQRVDGDLLYRLPASVRVIGTYSVGTDHVDLIAAKALSIPVLNTPDVLTEAVAEIGLFLMLGAARRATESIDLIRSRRWPGWTATQLPGVQLSGRRLGIVGMGRIGRAIAQRARAFGMQVHYFNRNRLLPQLEDGAIRQDSLRGLLAVSDCLLLACPATPDTIGLLDAAALAAMPHKALVVNISRGNVVDDDALIESLSSGKLLAAGLDVFGNEPRIDPRYFDLPNVFMTPHIGSSTLEAREQMARALIEGAMRTLRGETAENRVG